MSMLILLPFPSATINFNHSINSKRRHLLRKKVSVEKDKFKSLVETYNKIVTCIGPVNGSQIKLLDAVNSHDALPWTNVENDGNGIFAI